jgi:response regulator of citrate/malate metabolism
MGILQGSMTGIETEPQATWSVLIVEDSADVALIHRRVVDGTPGFSALAVVPNGDRAWEATRLYRPDVAIVDLAMPGSDGLGFLRRVRQDALPLEVVIVSASRDPDTIRKAMHLGVCDYLVKPFAPERLRHSLEAFARRARVLRRSNLAQSDVDLVQASGARIPRLPKGLKARTLEQITTVLRTADVSVTSDEAAAAIGVSRVTARRYLEYLEVNGLASMSHDYGAHGRPRNRYRWRGQNPDPIVSRT